MSAEEKPNAMARLEAELNRRRSPGERIPENSLNWEQGTTRQTQETDWLTVAVRTAIILGCLAIGIARTAGRKARRYARTTSNHRVNTPADVVYQLEELPNEN